MITEDYVSFETAKLLKEKGFNEPCICYSYDEGMNSYFSKPRIINNSNKDASYIMLPTLQMAMKWLREEKNIFIDVYYDSDIKGYLYSIIKLPKGTTLNVSDLADDTYEVACEEAIKYCLENIL